MKLTLVVLLLASGLLSASAFRSWQCDNKACTKGAVDESANAVSIGECKITCLEAGGLWPKPTGTVELSNQLITISIETSIFRNVGVSAQVESLYLKMQQRFIEDVKSLRGKLPEGKWSEKETVYSLNITTNIKDISVTAFTEFADESYSLTVLPPAGGSNSVIISIDANTVLGARHGLTTLSQLVTYDDLHGRWRMHNQAKITDSPVFTHRGLNLDTARTYMSVDTLLDTISNMGQFKLNTFHWHLTDSHSFPYVSKAYPELSREGAYSESEVYTAENIKTIVDYAKSRGVRVIPEFDAPAHVGEGWSALGDNLVTCFKWEPWTKYCVEPPCGQFNPTTDKVYEVLGAIFREYVELFGSDLFHMGGDEVNLNCWKSTPQIVEWMNSNNYPNTDDGFVKLWSMYQNRSQAQLRASKPEGKSILWSSTLTDEGHVNLLDPAEYIIQYWSTKTDQTVSRLINKNFSIIFTNYDELYLDCGGGAWIGGPGQNWCSPYIGWQAVYRHSPYTIAQNQGITLTEQVKKLLLGSEGTLWTEQVDGSTVHGRLWPRAAALAERLWSNPTEDWPAAQYRMNHQRARLGHGEQLQPTWCTQNDGYCGLGE